MGLCYLETGDYLLSSETAALCEELNVLFQVQRPVEESTGQSIPKTFLNSDCIAELNQSLSIRPTKFAPAQRYGGEGRRSKAR